MNKSFIFILSLLTLHFALLTFISAHILKTDGTIGAIIHVDPDDDPVAGAPSNLFWDFTDKEGKFTLENCVCYVSVVESGKEIAKEQLVNEIFIYTFPRKNIYQIYVSGSPRLNNSFQPFILSYDIRVERETTPQPETNINKKITLQQLLLGATIGTIGAVVVLWPMRRKLKK